MSPEITQELKAQQEVAKTNARLDQHEREALLALLEGRWSQFAVELNNWEQVNHKLPTPRKMNLQRNLSLAAGSALLIRPDTVVDKSMCERVENAKILFK